MRRYVVKRRYWVTAFVMVAYDATVVALDKAGSSIDVPLGFLTLLGAAMSILLGFRTGSAYDRWWEARKIWGSVVNDSRTFARQVVTLLRGEGAADQQREMVYRHISWCHALRHSLRGEEPFDDLRRLLPADELDALRAQGNLPNAILQTQGERLVDAQRAGKIERLQFLPLEATLKRFSDHMGMAERIKATVFPTQYRFAVSAVLWLFFLLLPAGLAPHLGWQTIPITFVTNAVFIMVENAGRDLENPFENAATDTPMTSICRTIEINLRQQLGETNVPAELEPVDGVLM